MVLVIEASPGQRWFVECPRAFSYPEEVCHLNAEAGRCVLLVRGGGIGKRPNSARSQVPYDSGIMLHQIAARAMSSQCRGIGFPAKGLNVARRRDAVALDIVITGFAPGVSNIFSQGEAAADLTRDPFQGLDTDH